MLPNANVRVSRRVRCSTHWAAIAAVPIFPTTISLARYYVMMQASPEYRLDEQALGNMFVRNGTEMAPVSQFVTLNKVLGPETANRFNLYSAIAANVNPAEGYSSGEVQKVIAEVAEQTLPLGYGYEYGGMAREEANTGGDACLYLCHLYLPYLSHPMSL